MTAPGKRVRLLISGIVQGVFYRAETRRQAMSLGLCGYARNLPDGRVEVLVEGPAGQVDALIAWCRTGPPLARVDRVAVAEDASGEALAGFHIG